jgi:Cellulase (glycosyl hydrolase family 5)
LALTGLPGDYRLKWYGIDGPQVSASRPIQPAALVGKLTVFLAIMKAKLQRRKFLKALSAVAMTSAASPALQASAVRQSASERPRALVFFESGFPALNGCGVKRSDLEQALAGFAVEYLSAAELIVRLNSAPIDLLITPYGSAFPLEAWPSLLQYLRSGGNWMNLGGAPLTVPVRREAGRWVPEEEQTTYHRRIGVTQSYAVKTDAINVYRDHDTCPSDCRIVGQFQAKEIYELYVRLTSKTEILDESGSDGPREAVLQSLVLGLNRQGRPLAAPVIQIDRLAGDFAGGRWLFANFSGAITAQAIRSLALLAVAGASEFLVHAGWACYLPEEIPSFNVQLSRPKGKLARLVRDDCRIEVRNDSDAVVGQLRVPLTGSDSQLNGALRLDAKLPPGFYKATAILNVHSTSDGALRELKYTSGFWVYDAEVMKRGRAFTTDRHFFYRDNQVYPVVGTTYMASDTHRRFLFEPNPFIWEQDFRAMKEAGVNMVRTGIWTGWKKFMPDPVTGVDEASLRALDAFLLTAHRNDIPVIFTFFAFLPETWGGENAYLDPKALRAQQQFITSFTRRYAEVVDVIWDLINEPSFCSPRHLWSCRPNYDAFEQAAWRDWLQERYRFPTDEARAAALKNLWHTSDEVFDLPRLEDFENVNIFATRLPLKTLDYRLFAQDMFTRWVRAMTAAIKANGNQQQLITVGQDEGGTGESPSQQLFAGAVDFTCLHNWWNNDELLWDSVVTKAPEKPSLVEETGVMFYERMNGIAWRSEEDARNLLERKLAISLGADGAGAVEWIWNTNCYMDSENEVAIGFYRADGTAKPELEPFLNIAKFMTRHRSLMQGRQDEDVLMVIPHSQLLSTRNFATEATRKCVRVMHYHCGTPLRAVSEYRLRGSGETAKMIVVPSPRVLTQECWETLQARAGAGATIVITGVLDDDEHWMPVARTRGLGRSVVTRPVSQSEVVTIGGREYLARYEGEKLQRIEKAVVAGRAGVAEVVVQRVGSGQFIWCPLPLELGESPGPLVAFYRFALAQARVPAIFSTTPATSAILVRPTVFATAVLYTIVSETSRDTDIRLRHLEAPAAVSLSVPAQRALMLFLDRKTGRLIGST